MCIDHINRVRTDNRWSNLRLVTQMQNAQNRNYKANQSGFTGVHPYKKSGKWTSEVRVSGKKYNLGQFATAEAAYNARLLKIQDLRAAQP